ncbi:MAG: DsbE family thiol:disulfide interchange protein [Janthinobacterium lividum]
MNRRALLLAPFGVAVLAGAGFWTVLGRMRQGSFDPHDVPSPLLGKPVPDFTLPGLAAHQGFGAADLLAQLRAGGRPMLVNFFASWCVPCVIEHPELMALSREGLPIWGIAYKDKPEAASGFVAQRGNPFQRIAADQPGRVAIDWGVYGVPESYLVDAGGVIRWRMAGPITPQIAAEQLRPLLKTLA